MGKDRTTFLAQTRFKELATRLCGIADNKYFLARRRWSE
jgi:hypothetical protein